MAKSTATSRKAKLRSEHAMMWQCKAPRHYVRYASCCLWPQFSQNHNCALTWDEALLPSKPANWPLCYSHPAQPQSQIAWNFRFLLSLANSLHCSQHSLMNSHCSTPEAAEFGEWAIGHEALQACADAKNGSPCIKLSILPNWHLSPVSLYQAAEIWMVLFSLPSQNFITNEKSDFYQR